MLMEALISYEKLLTSQDSNLELTRVTLYDPWTVH